MGKELHQILRHLPDIILIRQNNHGMRAYKTAFLSQPAAEIKRNICFAGGQNAA